MDILSILQVIPLLITCGYLEYDMIKLYKRNNNFAKMEKQNDENMIEYYKKCNQILKEILTDFQINRFPVLIPPYIPYSEEEFINIVYYNDVDPELKPLINTLINYIEPKHLTRLISNLWDIEIINKPHTFLSSFYMPSGEYDDRKNIIYNYKNDKETLSHEFLHMASSIVINDFSYIGFRMGNDYETFFNGFNEGYTEVLNERIFGAKVIGYPTNYTVCQLLETMFDDKRELEIAYFNNQIHIFIDKFLTYGTEKELSDVLEALDYFAVETRDYSERILLIDKVFEIISRKNELNKILKCEQIKEEDKKNNSFIKRLVK